MRTIKEIALDLLEKYSDIKQSFIGEHYDDPSLFDPLSDSREQELELLRLECVRIKKEIEESEPMAEGIRFDDIEKLIKLVKESNVEVTVRITDEGHEVEIQPHTFGWTSTTTPCIVNGHEQEHE